MNEVLVFGVILMAGLLFLEVSDRLFYNKAKLSELVIL